MLENAWYSVISPENCSTILWRTWDYKEQAADALKLTSTDMMQNKLIDGVIPEPLGGAHLNWDDMMATMKNVILKNIAELEQIPARDRIDSRIEKYASMGVVA